MKKAFIFLLLVFLTGTVIIFFWLHKITNNVLIPHSKSSVVSNNTIQQSFNNKTPINILLLGYGGGSHDGAYLTDSMMVIHIDPKAQKVFLISIPRDIWIKIPTDGETSSYWKINAAYTIGMDDQSYPHKKPQFKGADGGGRLAEYVVSQVTGLPIDYFIGMDFTGFKHTIDTLGGVDINEEAAFTDPEYPIDGKETDLCGHQQSEIPALDAKAASTSPELVYPCRYITLHFDAGMQHMDGERALSYVRSRHSLQDGTDFGRAKRQRNLLVAVKQKVISAGVIPNIIPFISSLGDDLKTDLSIDDVKIFIQNASSLSKYQISTLALTDQNFLTDTFSDDGQAILEPKDGLNNWTSVHNWISDEINGIIKPVPPIVQVENGTHLVGLAGLATNRLNNFNIKTLDPKSADSQSYEKTTITVYSPNIDQMILIKIKQEFGITQVQTETNSGDNLNYNILVIVGTDYNQKEGKKVLNE